MLIGLSGRLRSGKDSAYQFIRELYPEAERLAFADQMKASAAGALGCTRDAIEQLKGNEQARFILIDASGSIRSDLVPPFTMRDYLQRYGTEGHRQIFGESFWVDMTLPLDLDHNSRLIVCTDVRFENEAQRIKELGGVLVRVERETETRHAGHVSERSLEEWIDCRLDNRGTLVELRSGVEALLERLLVAG